MFEDVSSEEGSGEQVYHLWDRGMRRVLDPASIEALVKLVAKEMEVTQMAQTAAESFKAEGIVEGKRDTILQFLRFQFQDIPEPLNQRIAAIENVSDLDALLKQAMTAKSLDDLQI